MYTSETSGVRVRVNASDRPSGDIAGSASYAFGGGEVSWRRSPVATERANRMDSRALGLSITTSHWLSGDQDVYGPMIPVVTPFGSITSAMLRSGPPIEGISSTCCFG